MNRWIVLLIGCLAFLGIVHYIDSMEMKDKVESIYDYAIFLDYENPVGARTQFINNTYVGHIIPNTYCSEIFANGNNVSELFYLNLTYFDSLDKNEILMI